jgi:NHLM bacteriocin system ABC transporter peptidase/ATP-binding protein
LLYQPCASLWVFIRMAEKQDKKLNAKRYVKRRRTPTVLQMEAVECGAAALAIVLQYYKKYVSLEELRVKCGVSRDGAKASNIMIAARSMGLTAKGMSLSLKKVLDKPVPLIVFWNFNHFLVLEGVDGDKVYLNDPSTGPRTVTWDEFDASFSGVSILLEPNEEFIADGKKPSILGALRRRLDNSWTDVQFLFLVGLGLVVPGLLVPIFTKVFVDNVMIGQLEDWFRPLLVVMGITTVLVGVLTWLKEYYLIRLETKVALRESAAFFWHVLHLPVLFYTQRSEGDIASRVGINDTIARLLSRDLMSTALDLVAVIFFGALLLAYDVTLAAIGFTIVAVNIAYLSWVSRKRRDLSLKTQQDTGKLMGASMNGLLAIETLKASGRENDFFSQWSGFHAKVFNADQQLNATTNLLNSVPVLLSALNTAAVISLGGLRVMDGQLTMGELAAFQALMYAFVAPVNNLVNMAGKIQQLEGDMTRIDDVLKYDTDPILELENEEHDFDSNDGDVRLDGELELRNVSFGYSPIDPPLIDGLNIKIAPGKRVALVGPSGSGKSTVSKLVMGLYETWGGEILFDGKPRKQISRICMVNSLAMVDQNISVIESSVRDNLTLWDRTIPDSTVVEATKDAAIHDVIAARRGGYDSDVEEAGGNFSGGQLQRLEIARALVTGPRILVLDEATSALDPATEKRIDGNLRRRGCTCLIVAHRLSTIRDCDEIIVMDRGAIAQRGTHEELLEDADGIYANMVNL